DESTDQDREQRGVGGDEGSNEGQVPDDDQAAGEGAGGDAASEQEPDAQDIGSDEDQQRPEPESSERADRPDAKGRRAAQASTEPDLSAADRAAESVDRFDQQGALPWQALDPEQGISDRPALDGEAALGPGMAVIEQRLQQVEGDPTHLMRNQFRLEEALRLRESGGQLQEARPW
ncbi:MAG: hypothetical protein K9L82_15125, partial [Chromatiaceae bacterium]|nr:hypothetical protein [Chromatiaceae bacterium]